MLGKKERVAELQASRKTIYDQQHEGVDRELEQAKKGKRLIKGKQIPFEQNRQGFIKWYTPEGTTDLASRTSAV